MPGEFAVRGGILDIYPLTEENPLRIEMWGDTIDSLRSFEAESQRSIENLEEITLYPATELVRTEAGGLEENSTGSGKSRKEVPRPDEK
jgi:transcription-repair coupling factor (superfamily II helicase)